MKKTHFKHIPYYNIRAHYDRLTPMIMEQSQRLVYKWVNPYSEYTDFVSLFTPIERDMWNQIRAFGFAPMYPQYPAGRFFLDFANPFIKIAIECDGKEFHQDVEKDYERDQWLLRNGWTVYRIEGKHCVKQLDDYPYIDQANPDYDEIQREFFEETAEGLVRAIGIIHFGMPRNKMKGEDGAAHNALYKLNRLQNGMRKYNPAYS